METRNEIWKDIEGWEGHYQVSNMGRVRSLDRIGYQCNKEGTIVAHKHYGRILKPLTSLNGYLHVGFHWNNVTTFQRIHRLVAMAFVPGYSEGMEVNHIDENKENNCADNLEWVSRKTNLNISSALECWHRKLRRPIIQMTLDGVFIRRWPSIDKASRELGLHRQCISSVCKGKYKSSGGYRWRFADD